MLLFGSRRRRWWRTPPLLALLAGLAASPLGDAAAPAGCAEHLPYGAPVGSAAASVAEVRLCPAAAQDGESFFALGYDAARGVARWTAYRLTRDRLRLGVEAGSARRARGRRFRRDPRLEAQGGPRLSHEDFTGSGYDRGHLVPAAAMRWHAEAYEATFLVSNLALQDPSLNRGAWRRLEAKVRTWTCAFGELYVITGTVSRSAEKGDAGPKIYRVNGGAHQVAVPSAFYKLLFSETDGGQAMAVVYGNPDPGSPAPAPMLRSVDDLEALSGLDFFPGMDETRQRRIEAAAPNPDFWEGRIAAAGHCA